MMSRFEEGVCVVVVAQLYLLGTTVSVSQSGKMPIGIGACSSRFPLRLPPPRLIWELQSSGADKIISCFYSNITYVQICQFTISSYSNP